jgi:hypothetical protein
VNVVTSERNRAGSPGPLSIKVMQQTLNLRKTGRYGQGARRDDGKSHPITVSRC